MSEESPQRVKQWFARGIGIVVSGIFISLLSLTLLNLDQHLFHTDLDLPAVFDYVLLAEKIGSTMWTFRVLDLLLMLIIIFLGIISAYYLIGYKSMIASSNSRDQRRYR